MKQRLEYIDSLKGFAILIVVMGHVIAWFFNSYEEALKIQPSPMTLWSIIYSFHMPLFIFISGFLFGQSHFSSLKEYALKMWKKMKMLIIPWVVCGVLIKLFRGGQTLTYWYLLTLFQLLVIVGIENYFLDKIKNKTHQIIVEILTLGVTHLLIYCVGKVYDGPALYICYDWYPHLSWMFGYFALGSFIMRHQEISKLMNGKVYTLCLLFFCVSSVVDVPHISITSINLHSLAGIYCSLYLFKVCFTEGKAIEYLKRIGVKTLQIYILHLFFGMKLTQIGDYLTTLVQGGQSGFATSLVIQLLLSLSISIIIIELSLIAAKIIKTSKLCSFLMLGE